MNELIDASLPVHPQTGLVAIGVLPSGRIVWPVLGGAPEDNEDTGIDDGGQDEDTDDEDTGTGDDSGDDSTDDEDTDDTGKASGNDTVSRAELNKAIRERQRAKERLRKKEQELEELRKASEGAEEKAAREAREEAVRTAEAKLKPIAIRAALLEAGVKPGKIKGATRLLELGEIDVDEDGDVLGLEEQLEELREDWPELFAPAPSEKPEKPRRRSPGSRSADGADKKPEKPKQRIEDRLVAQLRGGR